MRFSRPAALIGLLLAVPGAVGQAVPAPAAPRGTLGAVEITGGSPDDQSYASAALGLVAGKPLGDDGFRMALAAVRATDRFRTVDGSLEEGPKGLLAKVGLDPWPAIESREIRGTVPRSLLKNLFTGMHKGSRAGDLRIQRWQLEAERRLQEAGYLGAKVRIDRQEQGARLVIDIDTGAPALVRALEVEGDPSPYSARTLKDLTEIQPGKSLWTAGLQRQALDALRHRLVADHRLEGTAEFAWDEASGRLALKVAPGPVVRIRKEGDWSFWWKDLEDLVPLARAGRYSPELLDEGDRKILRFLRDEGYLEAQVGHRREILRGTAEKPQEVSITFSVQPGVKTRISEVRFEKNKDIPEADLQKAAALPSGVWSLGAPTATPELINELEDRVKALYWSRGYPDVSIRRPPMERVDGKTKLVFQVREGAYQALDRIVLEVPSDPSWQPWALAECLPLILSERLVVESQPDASTRVYRSDRAAAEDVAGTLRESLDPARPEVRTFTLTTSKSIPFVKSDLALVYSTLRQRLGALGLQRPMPKLRLNPSEHGYIVQITVPDEPRVTVNRLVVQGSDSTKAKAVLRENTLEPGMPLDPGKLSRTQSNLANLGAYQRIDMMNLAQVPEEGGPLPWEEGDLFLRADERSPWVLNSGFGYDKSHGYHVGAGAQRQNFLGMGRTLDFGIRAGDATIDNPTLRRWFPTGTFDRSLDSYSVGYTDPWFLPGGLKGLISDRIQYRAEAAYIEENQAAYKARRRQLTNTFDWKVGDFQTLRLGHRYERIGIQANAEGIMQEDLFTLAGVPGSLTVISAPFFQFTRDKRDHPLDPKDGTFFQARLEMANQLFGTGAEYSYVKLDMRHQWYWSFGEQASKGVVMASARLGLARPTTATADNLPLTERFFAGGPFTVRGVEPDMLGPTGKLPVYDYAGGTAVQTGTKTIPLGGQGLVVLNLEYRFPILGSQTVWGEVFADSGQVYAKLNPAKREPGDPAPFPHLRTTLGLGLILKLGLPIKLEYAADLKRILGKPLSQSEEDTAMKGILVSAGYQY
ncbi:MAG TPA: BamA/TamA family outer membrane protein [Holophaga sp.]|nr:BamA/TamA family outer membrane protein [Holophaga sp.]